MVFHVMELVGELGAMWYYPVKSLAGRALTQTLLEADGIPGDRANALFVRSGHARVGKAYRGKEHNRLHTLAAASEASALARCEGVELELHGEAGMRYFDDAPVSLLFDLWIAELEQALALPLDPRRWRPNLYARACAHFRLHEPDLIGRTIELGGAVLRVRDTIRRCVTTTYDVETGESNADVLRYVAQQRDNVMGVYCEVELAGTVRVGDVLRLRDR